MKKLLNDYKFNLVGALLGAIAGYLYWQQIGCLSGTCMIISKPLNSTLYGAFMGTLLLGMFKKENKKQELPEEKKINPLVNNFI